MTNTATTRRIAELNDLCRKAPGVAGRLFQTSGIDARPIADQSAIREKVELVVRLRPQAALTQAIKRPAREVVSAGGNGKRRKGRPQEAFAAK